MGDLVGYLLLSVPFVGAYAMFALGITVIYRASRVLNLAHGAMAMIPAYVLYTLTNAHVPLVAGLPVSVASGAVLGVAVERVFVRRLRRQGPTAQTVGTVAVTGLLIALAGKLWGTTPHIAPQVFPRGFVTVAGTALRWGDIGLFVTGVGVSLGLFAFFKFTQVGLAMRGAAENRRAASLMGIDPDLTAAAAWALGGGLAALGGVLLAAVTDLDPYNLSLQVLPAFVAALLGGLESLAGGLVGAVIAGVVFGLVPLLRGLPVVGRVMSYSGASQLLLALLAMVVMAVRGRRFAAGDGGEAGLSGARVSRRSRGISPFALILAATAAVVVPLVAPYSVLGDGLLAVEFALAAISVVVLTGWVGQISLAQASFVGISALMTGIAVRSMHASFPANLVIATAAAGAAAVLLGIVALRVRGLYLAVATLIFAWMVDQFLVPSPWLGADSGSSTIPAQSLGVPGGIPFVDLGDRKPLFIVMLAVLVAVVFALSNLRDTKTGRAFFAVRGSEVAATSLGIDVVRYKLVAFGLAGVIAGLAGNLIMVEQRTVVPAQFVLTVSLQYLAIAVVGGLGSMGGAVAAGVLFAALHELFFSVPFLAGWLDVVSAALLAGVLLLYPGGLAAVPGGVQRAVRLVRARLRRQPETAPAGPPKLVALPVPRIAGMTAGLPRRLRPVLSVARAVRQRVGGRRPRLAPGTVSLRPDDWFTALRPAGAVAVATSGGGGTTDLARRDEPRQPAPTLLGLAAAAQTHSQLPRDRGARTPLLEAEGVTVRFGGLTAVNAAGLSVREGEVVGLIGPNGAGKTTLFNAVLGLNSPVAGTVRLHGHDVTGLPPHQRARLGLARTFQALQLFRELTVFDNVLVATHLHNHSGLLSNLAASPRTLRAESELRSRVDQVLGMLDLVDVADRPVQGLPFGTLRMVELARALVTGARLLMLDEPASGLNERETDRLAAVVRSVRALGVSVLLIEHDVRLVSGVSDYVYMLDQGCLVAEGEPGAVRNDPRVIAAYLGHATATAAGA